MINQQIQPSSRQLTIIEKIDLRYLRKLFFPIPVQTDMFYACCPETQIWKIAHLELIYQSETEPPFYPWRNHLWLKEILRPYMQQSKGIFKSGMECTQGSRYGW